MPDYKYAETSYAMRKIREMFSLAKELAPQIERCTAAANPHCSCGAEMNGASTVPGLFSIRMKPLHDAAWNV